MYLGLDSEPASGLFLVNASSGELYVNGMIDRENVSSFQIRVLVRFEFDK